MNLSAKTLGLVVISALFFFSCKKREDVGLKLQPDHNKIGVAYTDTITLHTQIELDNDSIVTSNLSYLLMGSYSDPVFGNITAEAFTQLYQNSENKNVSGYQAIDSVVLNLSYYSYYGDTTVAQTLDVHQLTEPLSSTDTFFTKTPRKGISSSRIDLDESFELRPSKRFQKVNISNAFGSQILDLIGTGKSNTDFKTAFNGIALIPKNQGEGSVMGINLGASKLNIYYKNSSSSLDSVNLILGTSGARYYRVSSDGNTIPLLSGLTKDGDQVDGQGKVFIQSALGIRTKIEFPSASDFLRKVGNVAINQATLLVQMDSLDPNVKKFEPINRLVLIKQNANGKALKYLSGTKYLYWFIQNNDVADVHGTASPYQLDYTNKSYQYSFNISNYFHALVYGTESNYGLIIAPPPGLNPLYVNRVMATGTGNSKIKLLVYYTKI